jgi:hypothetical protein
MVAVKQEMDNTAIANIAVLMKLKVVTVNKCQGVNTKSWSQKKKKLSIKRRDEKKR